MSVKTTGLAEIMAASDTIIDALEEAQEIIAERTLIKARANAPFVTGFLRSSGHADKTDDGWVIQFTARYASTVHEAPRSSGYKFLERAIEEAASTYESDLAKAARGALKVNRGVRTPSFEENFLARHFPDLAD